MSIGPLPPTGNVAGSPLAQSVGSDSDAKKEVSDKGRAQAADRAAEAASGIGKTDEDSEAEDRDADGRLPWERKAAPADATDDESGERGESGERSSPDPEGLRGNRLDLSI